MKIKRRRRTLLRILMGIFGVMTVGVMGVFLVAEVVGAWRPEEVAGRCSVADAEAPEMVMVGEEVVTVIAGSEYVDAGVEAVDDCGVVEVAAVGEVDTGTVGSYRIVYTATDAAGNAAELTRKVRVVASRGTIYLTFDDGPGVYTAELLDVLKKYDVKATFFVTGAGSDEMILREYEEGHAVGLHTWSHDYSYVYRNTENFWEDMLKVQERVKNITGFTSYLMRFPGGSSNTVSARYDGRTRIMSRLVAEAAERGFAYFDWNISSGDAEGGGGSTEKVYARVTGELREGDNVVLQHDIKGFSVAAVEEIIKYGLANGFSFAALDLDSYGAHHGVNN